MWSSLTDIVDTKIVISFESCNGKEFNFRITGCNVWSVINLKLAWMLQYHNQPAHGRRICGQLHDIRICLQFTMMFYDEFPYEVALSFNGVFLYSDTQQK